MKLWNEIAQLPQIPLQKPGPTRNEPAYKLPEKKPEAPIERVKTPV